MKLKFAQDLSSKTATDDDPVNLVLDEDLKVGDVTVVKAGAKALASFCRKTQNNPSNQAFGNFFQLFAFFP